MLNLYIEYNSINNAYRNFTKTKVQYLPIFRIEKWELLVIFSIANYGKICI